MSGRNPPLYCTLTLWIAMQGHHKNSRDKKVHHQTVKTNPIQHWNGNRGGPWWWCGVFILSKYKTPFTQGSKRQAERTGFLAQYLSGLRHADAPHTWTLAMASRWPGHKRKKHLFVKVTKYAFATKCNLPSKFHYLRPPSFIPRCRACLASSIILGSIINARILNFAQCWIVSLYVLTLNDVARD